MYYFMVIFLTGFLALSWREMASDPVLDIWRKVIGLGIPFTAAGAASFHLNPYTGVLRSVTLGYWFLAPGAAMYLSAEHMDRYGELYRQLSVASVLSLMIFFTGYIYSGILIGIGIVGIAASQTVSILKASELDR